MAEQKRKTGAGKTTAALTNRRCNSLEEVLKGPGAIPAAVLLDERKESRSYIHSAHDTCNDDHVKETLAYAALRLTRLIGDAVDHDRQPLPNVDPVWGP